MAQNLPSNLVSPEALSLGYEPESLRFRGFALAVVVGAIVVGVIHIGLWYLMKQIDGNDASGDLPRSIVQTLSSAPGPKLQPSVRHDSLPYQDLAALRQDEDVLFSKLGWEVNAQTHAVRAPDEIIERVRDQERERAAAKPILPTTTGKPTNSIVPATTPPYDTQPGINGGQRP